MKVLDILFTVFSIFLRLYKRRRLFLNCLGYFGITKKQHTIYIFGGDGVETMP